jgi:hypothetical protein
LPTGDHVVLSSNQCREMTRRKHAPRLGARPP